MATLVLGGLGAGIGALVGGPAGLIKGYQIGSVVGGVIDEISANQRALRAGLLSDLTYSGSSYGASIPRVWGSGVVGGLIHWIKTDSNGNSLVKQDHHASIGGKAAVTNPVTGYYYTATWGFMLCEGQMTFPDGTSVDRNHTLGRVWFDDQLVWAPGPTMYITGTPNGGTFTLSFGGQTTAAIPYNATAAQVQSALSALSSVGAGNVACVGGDFPKYPITVCWKGSLFGSRATLGVSVSLTGGTPFFGITQVGTYPLTYGTNLTFHSGSETQGTDATIAAALTNTPAYRGVCYCVVNDVDLSPYGNRVPSCKAEIVTDPVLIGDVISDVCRASGLAAADINVSGLTQSLRGIVETNATPASETIKAICGTYLIDPVEADGVIHFVERGGAIAATIDWNDLGASGNDLGASASRYRRVRKSLTDLPGEFSIVYLNQDADYQQATQTDIKTSAPIYNQISFATPMLMNPVEAQQIAAQQLDTAWLECDEYTFSLPMKYLYLMPSDPVLLPLSLGGSTVRLRVTEMTLAPKGRVEFKAVPDATTTSTQNGTNSGGGSGSTTPPPSIVPTEWTQWSGHEIQDADQSYPGFYVAAAGNVGWNGCTVYYSLDGGATYVTGPSITYGSTFGVTTGALANGTTALSFDNTNTVGVDVTTSYGVLASVPDGSILAGTNSALVGGEILGVGTVSLTSAFHYTISHLYRGERGSAMTGHASGEQFVILSDALAHVQLSEALVGTTVYIKCLSPGQALTDVTAQTVVILERTLPASEIKLNSLKQFTFITPVTLLSAVTTTAGWTTLNLSGDVPATATHAVFEYEWAMAAVGETLHLDAYLWMRANGAAQQYLVCRGRTNGGAEDIAGGGQTAIMPISGTQTVDYEIIQGFDNGLTLRLIGYWS